MKKNLLFMIGLMSAVGAFSQNEPLIVKDFYSNQISPNGKWLLGDETDGNFNYSTNIYDIETGNIYRTGGNYGYGAGVCISNDGIAIGSAKSSETGDLYVPYILVPGGEPVVLSNLKSTTGMDCNVNAISADANVFLGFYQQNLYIEPFVCALGDDFTPGEPVFLPIPDKDVTGAIPFSVNAVAMSSDASVIAGMVTTGDESFSYPIIWTAENGEWAYSFPAADYYQSEASAFPHFFDSPYIALSPDGTKLVCNEYFGELLSVQYKTWVFDLKNKTVANYGTDGKYILGSRVLDDGTVTGITVGVESQSYVLKAGATQYMSIIEYAANIKPEYAEWMNNNLVIEDLAGWGEDGLPVWVEIVATGNVWFTPDLSKFGAGHYYYDEKTYDEVFFTYIFTDPLANSGVKGLPVLQDDLVRVYNLQGQLVMTVSNQDDIKGLQPGIYIVNGQKIALK